MSLIVYDIDRLIEENGLRSTRLVKEVKDRHGTRSLPALIAMLGDGDWNAHSLFEHFRLTSLVKATYQVRRDRIVTDDRFLKQLEKECFWKLNRQQTFRVATELLYLFPEQFQHLTRWLEETAP
jgi:hypothetical protein